MLKTKSILYDKEDTDGLRISVMSRHTLNDGITPHPEITDSSYNQWLQILAPPVKLLTTLAKSSAALDPRLTFSPATSAFLIKSEK